MRKDSWGRGIGAGGRGGQANEKWRTKRGPGTGGRDGASEEREVSSGGLRKMGRKKSTMNWAAELSAGRWALGAARPSAGFPPRGGRREKPDRAKYPPRPGPRLGKALRL